jgi:hypothetical protein
VAVKAANMTNSLCWEATAKLELKARQRASSPLFDVCNLGKIDGWFTSTLL